MHNLFIIHSYNADTKDSFGPYIVEHGTELGYNVIFPDFPIRTEADFRLWTEKMDDYLAGGELNENSIVIAHSLGTHFIPKYLVSRNRTIKLFISVAGFLNDHSGREDLRAIVNQFTPDDEEIEHAKSLMQNRYSIYSNNDHMNPQSELEYYADKFDSKKVFIRDAGHFGKQSAVKEIPEIFDIIDKIYNEKKAK